MNPLLYYDSIYSLTSMKKQEDSHRQFIFEFISNEWNKLLMEPATESDAMSENSFIRQLIRVSKNGREYSPDEINDHVGTMLVAVSFIYFCRLLFATFLRWQQLFLLSLTAFTAALLPCDAIIIFNYRPPFFYTTKAGDTMSTALNFLFLMLAMHESVQHRIVGEINEVFGEYKDLIIDCEKLSELKYVEMVIKETLRLFSPATGKPPPSNRLSQMVFFLKSCFPLFRFRHFPGGEKRRRLGERRAG